MTQHRHYLALTIISLIVCWTGLIGTARADSRPFADTIQHRRFIAYTPRSFSIVANKVVPASAAGIRDDLKLLRPFFDGVITYSATDGVEAVPKIARDLGYRAVIIGIWDPKSEAEIQNVMVAVKKYPTLIAAVIVGNEGLYGNRYRPDDVQKTIQRLRLAFPALPTTTSEPFFLYFKPELADFFHAHDLLMPNVHPVFEKWFDPRVPSQGVEMVIQVAAKFKQHYPRPLLIKETGVPSGQGSRGFSAEGQRQFWAELFKQFPLSNHQSFACFEAFDAPWKPAEIANLLPGEPGEHGDEAFWGFFTAQGQGKPALGILPKLAAD